MADAPSSPTRFLLFVYGTLMHGGERNRFLVGQKFLRAARTGPGYALYDLGAYPGLVPIADDSRVEGELYEVESSLQPLLDRIEGAPDLYRLAPIEVEGQSGPVLTYLYQREVTGRTRIADGRWQHPRAQTDSN